MKVKIELELSPSEAREMLGSPDFSQLHSIITKDLAEQFAQDPQKAFETFIKQHHMQSDTTHYGIFSGSIYRKNIRPLINEFMDKYC
jgi:hypothetical protein